MKIQLLLSGCLLFAFVSPAFAQQLDRGDTLEIQNKAQFCIKQFESLLNLLATKETAIRNYNMDDIGRNFYESHSDKQIFRDSLALIEDDLNPKALSVTYEKEKTIQQYLRDFRLFYGKSLGISVSFTNIQVSEIKEDDYLYVTVHYESEFYNRHKYHKDIPYPKHKRVATIKAIRRPDEWQTLITYIQFFRTPVIDREIAITLDATVTPPEEDAAAKALPQETSPEQTISNVADAYKRGSTFDIAWQQDFANPVTLSLYRGNTFQKELASSITKDEYAGIIPKKTKPGQAYRFQVYDPATQATLQSGNFQIKRKIPLGLQIPIYVGIAGGIVAIIQALSPPPPVPEPPPCTNCLPGPDDINPYQ